MTINSDNVRSRLQVLARELPGFAGISHMGVVAAFGSRQGDLKKHSHDQGNADLANFDPSLHSACVARNAAPLVWDTPYGVDATLQPQRQMVQSEEVSADSLTGTFRLRPGLQGLKLACSSQCATVDAASQLLGDLDIKGYGRLVCP